LKTAAASAGLGPRLRTLFNDAAVSQLVGADGIHEFPLALLSFGDGVPAVTPTGTATAGELPPVELGVCTQAQRAGDRDELGPPWPDGSALTEVPPSDPLDAVILRRGSQRLMDRSKTLPRASLEWPLAAALRGIDVPHWVGVSAVDDVPTGIHLWPDVTSPVRPLTEQAVRDELFAAALEQGLAGDASFVAMSGVPLDDLDDHAYREAQLLAGLAEGRLHLMAYALGAAASGMTFRDSDLAHLLGSDVAGLLWTCVGVPEYRTRRSGQPGSPADVTIVWPR
jgi:hypothetical protein